MGEHQKLDKTILLVITKRPERVKGAMPIFIVDEDADDEIQEKAHLFENLLGGMTHRVDEYTYVVVRH